MLVFASLKSLIPKVDGISTDNWVFRLHCNVTIIFLIGFTILATSKEYIGSPIECSIDTNTPSAGVINQYCWIQSTFSVVEYWKGEVGGFDAAHDGVGPVMRGYDTKVYHKYYQWVVFMLCLQAIMFYIPRYLWKVWEGGKTRMLLQDLNNPIVEEEEKAKKLELLSTYFVKTLGTHTTYALGYSLCELLNLINVVGQMFMIDKFLGGEFRNYGMEVFSFVNMDDRDRQDPMVRVFPRVTKCTFSYYGTGGDIQPKQALCVLPLNVINEKIYIFMWLWFCILTALSAVAVLYRLITFALPCVRILVVYLRCRFIPITNISSLVSHLGIGDWFLLYQISKNMDPSTFRDFVPLLSEKIEYNLKENGGNMKSLYGGKLTALLS